MTSEYVATRLPADLLRGVEELVKEEKVDRSAALRRLIDVGLKEMKRKKAVELYRSGKLTLGMAAEIAGMSVWAMAEVLRRENVPFNLDVDAVIDAVERESK